MIANLISILDENKIYTEYNGTIEEAMRRKEQMIAKGFQVLTEQTGKSAPGYWIKVVYLRPEKN